VLTDAVTTPTVSFSLGTLLFLAGGVLAIIDSGIRFRRPGRGAVLTIIELVLGLLLVIRTLSSVQSYVSTSIPVLYLATALAVVLLVQVLVKTSRKGGVLWFTIVALLVTGAAAVLAFLRVG
jgi:hypothetical protein